MNISQIVKSLSCCLIVSCIFLHAAVRGPSYDDVRAMGMGNTTVAVTTDRTAIFHNPAGLALIKDKFQCSMAPLTFSIDGIFFQLLREMVAQGDKLSDLSNVDGEFIDMINKYDGKWAGFAYMPEVSFATKNMGLGMYSVLPIGVRIEAGHLIPKLALRAERDLVFTYAAGFTLKPDKFYGGISIEYLQRTPLKVEMTKYSETFLLFDKITNSPLGIVGDYSDIEHGFSLDVGFMHHFWKGFRFAWDIKDLVGFVGREYVAPPQLDLGCAYFFPQLEKVDAIKNLICAFEITNIAGIEPITEKYEHFAKKIHIGAELDMHYGALRLGISQGYPTFGLGLRMGLFKADYAYHTEELGYYPGQLPKKQHILSLGVDFSVPKKEYVSLRMRPDDLYNKAKKLFDEERYYDAMVVFGKIIAEYPEFFKNDLVRLHIGQCQEYMDMRKSASANYLKTKKDYPQSPLLAYADLGLMHIYYRNGDSAGVARQFALLNRSVVKDSLRFHAFYYQAQAHIRLGAPQEAVNLLKQIPKNHPEYAFAQHSLAVMYVVLDSLNMAVTHLSNAVQVHPVTQVEEEIAYRSLVLMGYLFYEGLGDGKRFLSKAVAALRQVPNTSYYYEDALLGLAWCGATGARFDDCLKACAELRTISKKPILHCESLLLEAYVRIIQNKQQEALTILNEANAQMKNCTPPAEAEKDAISLDYVNNRKVYNGLAGKLDTIIVVKESRATRKLIDSLRTPQVENLTRLDELRKSLNEFNRQSFFARNIENVRNDIDYALVKTEKIVNQQSFENTLKKAAKKAKDIDIEVEKLQDKLEELNTQEAVQDSSEKKDSIQEVKPETQKEIFPIIETPEKTEPEQDTTGVEQTNPEDESIW